MARPYHVYRLSDCMERIGRCVGPILIAPCNQDCRPGASPCVHRHLFEALEDLPVPIISIHYRDLPDILMLHPGLRWGHSLLMYNGKAVRHWPSIPSRADLDAALAEIAAPQAK